MSKIIISLPDGSRKSYQSGVTVEEVAYSIGKGLGRAAVAGEVNGQLVDLKSVLSSDVELKIITLDSKEGLDIYRHTTAHIMAQAARRLFPEIKLAIGPTIENGFYYDFDRDQGFSPDDLEQIETEMKRIIKEDYPVTREIINRDNAMKFMQERGEDYKVELIKDLDSDFLTFYHQGEFTDLCRGPHLPSTGRVKAFKLLNIAGAYWRGDENNKMLQRIYGTAFPEKAQLDSYLERLEEAKKRDHRKLGKQLNLFSLHEEGPGFPFIHPKGMVIWNELISFWREKHIANGYQEIKTPVILSESLWRQSGHWDHYQDNMYFTEIDGQPYAIKPMNCPGGVLYYRNEIHSYREFPIRTAELGLVHRHERSGTLHGLMRVRAFTQDDAHIFMLPEQITEELINVLELVDDFYSVFGFNYHIELSTRPENSMGSDEDWELAINALKHALEIKEIDYTIDEGNGAFYGPKIDVHLEDNLGRTWQCSTIQLDFQMPERFNLTYVGSDGNEHRPVMIHRVIMGSIERFIGILIEHFGGAFPLWIAPVQVEIIPVSDDHLTYSLQVKRDLEREGIRVEIDKSPEKVGYKIRQAQLNQIPYMLIIGPKEVEENTVSVRERRKGDLGVFSIDYFRNEILEEINDKQY
jgi:threonyl-tRNA synthetase